jgi:glutathione S-transferase
MPKYTLHYFAGNGRAVIARALLTYAKADWTNDLIKHEDWPKIKKSGLCEFEQVPVLEVDGKKYCESHAINLYLAEVFNLMGKDAEENYQIRNVLMAFDDYMAPIWAALFCKDEAKKPELQKAAEEKLKFFFGKFEKRYVDLGKGKYFLGDKFTLADIVLGSALPAAVDALGLKDCPCKEVAPNLGELIKRLKENELKEFFEKFYIK